MIDDDKNSSCNGDVQHRDKASNRTDQQSQVASRHQQDASHPQDPNNPQQGDSGKEDLGKGGHAGGEAFLSRTSDVESAATLLSPSSLKIEQFGTLGAFRANEDP